MKITGSAARIGIATVVILGTVAWLATTGYKANKSYYVTIAELGGMGDKAYQSRLRVAGFVVPGSIQENGTHVDFVLNESDGHTPASGPDLKLKVAYNGSEPPPDTFKDNSAALAIGSYGRDGVFHASELQAKCASKYAPAGPNQPGPNQPGPNQPAAKPSVAKPGSTASAVAPAARPAA